MSLYITSSSRALRILLGALLLLTTPILARPLLLDGSLEAEIPAAFRPLDQAIVNELSAELSTKPVLVLATPDTQTRISVTHSRTSLNFEELDELKEAFKEQVSEQSNVTRWLRDESLTIHGHPWFRLDYEITRNSGVKREIVLATSLHHRLLYLVISAPNDDQDMLTVELQPFIDSLRVVKTSP